MVVEDDPFHVRLYGRLLGKLFRLDMATTLEEARKRLSAGPVDAMILDRALPDGNGLSFINELRGSEQHRDLLIFMVTADLQRETCLEALETGADEFMQKPLDVQMLVARLNSLARRKDRPYVAARPFSCDGLTYSPSSRKVYLNGKELPLRPKELSLLEFFMERPNVIHPPETVWKTVWGPFNVHWEHTLGSTLHNLRNDLGRWSSHLETHKGTGYTLSAPA